MADKINWGELEQMKELRVIKYHNIMHVSAFIILVMKKNVFLTKTLYLLL